MTRKNYFIYLTAVALFLTGSLAVFAQTAPTRGKIEFKKADGTTVPAASAVIDVYRTDAKGKLPAGKTNKKGEFAFAGLPLGQTFMFVVSGPEIQTQVFPNMKANQDNLVLTVYAGDGKPMTEEQARAVLAAPKNTGANNANGGGTAAAAAASNAPAPTKEEIEAAKKAQAEYEKKVAEVNAKNEKVKNINQIVDKAISEGKAAFDAKNYDAAIASYTAGVDADPEFAGTAPVFYNNRAFVLRARGYENYKKAATDAANKTTLMASAKKDFSDAINDFNKSLTILKAATTTDAKLQKDYESYKKTALAGLVETHRLMIGSRADQTRGKEAVAALDEYALIETDAPLKLKAQIQLADTLRSAGDSENAVPIYRRVLEVAPDNVDVMGGLGLSMVNVASASTTPDQAMMQDALNMLDRFVQTAPDTHPLKSNVKEVAEYLKTTGLKVQKTGKSAAPAKKKN